ncbi:hypothetical protein AB3N61_09335 [Leptospira sp. WS58.C1]|uniref:hypothetical protein n=1 Tax=Leptospira cinconiae TaxID=3235173 RepID=UPI00349E9FF3
MQNFKLIIVSLLFLSCCGYPRYTIQTCESISKEDIPKVREMAENLSKNVTANGLGGDYEDIDDTIYAATKSAMRLYTLDRDCLRIQFGPDSGYRFINESDLSERQKEIFLRLKEYPGEYTTKSDGTVGP